MRIAIAGAGIAGLTAAIALARRGFSVELHEREPELAEIGAGIQLAPNAMEMLGELDLGATLSGAVFPEAIEIREARGGAILTRIPLGATALARYGNSYCLIHRADLQSALLAAVRRDARIALLLGSEARDVVADDSGVSFRAAGLSVAADLLVIADGIHSRLRQEIFAHPGPPPLPLHAWRARLAVNQVPQSVDLQSTVLWLAPGAHLVHYPLRGGRELNVVAIAGAASAHAPPARIFGASLQPLLEAVPNWIRWPLHGVAVPRPWAAGRIVLIGDAAHAMPPTAAQGGAQAIEDACTLAASLAERADRPADALAAWEAMRRPRVERIAAESLRNLRLYHLAGLAALARDAAIRALPPKMHLARLDWLFGWKPRQKP